MGVSVLGGGVAKGVFFVLYNNKTRAIGWYKGRRNKGRRVYVYKERRLFLLYNKKTQAIGGKSKGIKVEGCKRTRVQG